MKLGRVQINFQPPWSFRYKILNIRNHLLKKRMMIFKVHQTCGIIVTYRLGIIIAVRSRQPMNQLPPWYKVCLQVDANQGIIVTRVSHDLNSELS